MNIMCLCPYYQYQLTRFLFFLLFLQYEENTSGLILECHAKTMLSKPC